MRYRTEEFQASIDRNAFKLFTQDDPSRYHCLLTLLTPVNVTSAPDGSKTQDKALPNFSFSYKANPPHYLRGTSKSYTLQFLKDVTYDMLNSLEERLVFRGSFSEDPCLCSLLLHTLPQKLLEDKYLNASSGSIISIFESRNYSKRLRELSSI